jgi:hypothetical protein
MLEKTLENKCRLYAKSIGWTSVKLNPVNAVGIPDRLFIGPGRVLFIEFKKPGQVPRKSQQVWIDKLLGYGMQVKVIDNFEDFQGMLDGSD